MKKTIVCGAGIGGLVTAIRLAEKGHPVEIYEMNNHAGGKMGEFRKDGFRFDTGPSVITMPEVIKSFFKDIGRDPDDYIELIEPDTACRYFWEDGTVFNSYSSKSKFNSEFEEVFSENELMNFEKFLSYGKNFFDIYNEVFGKDGFNFRDYLTRKYLGNFGKFISGRSINDLSNKFFKDKKLKQLINRYATFNGSSAYLCPQFFSILPYAEFEFGNYFIKGGMYELASALEKICGEYGILINYGHKLTEATGKNKNLDSLVFKKQDGSKAEMSGFDYVVCNFTNMSNLVPKSYFENTDWSSSGFILLMGIDRNYEELSYHNVLFSRDYESEYIDIFEKKIPAEDMTIYISISSKYNESDAPTGEENWFVFVNAPHLSDKFEWNEENKLGYFNAVINRLEEFNFLFEDSIRNHIKFYKIITPEDFETTMNCEHGSIYGLSSNSLYTMIRRIKNKSTIYGNLFFTGGNTNPGGGIPLCFLSGKIVSGMIN